MPYPDRGSGGDGEFPTSAGCALAALGFMAIAAGFGPSFCAWEARNNERTRADIQKIDAWDAACEKTGKVMHLGRGSTPDVICVQDGKIVGSR